MEIRKRSRVRCVGAKGCICSARYPLQRWCTQESLLFQENWCLASQYESLIVLETGAKGSSEESTISILGPMGLGSMMFRRSSCPSLVYSKPMVSFFSLWERTRSMSSLNESPKPRLENTLQCIAVLSSIATSFLYQDIILLYF